MNDDVRAVLARVDELGIVPTTEARGWTHMGAVVTDAALQAATSYRAVVLPRVQRMLAQWPDASTTSALLRRMESGDLAEVISWTPGTKKIATFEEIARFLGAEGVETVDDLRQNLGDKGFRTRLDAVKGVGSKTIDYLSILTGSTEHVAVDSQITAFVRDAGATATSYADIRQVIVDAAAERGWNAGDLDAAIWAYQSERNRPLAD